MKRLGELTSNMTVVFQKNRFLAKKNRFFVKNLGKKIKNFESATRPIE